MLCTQDEDASVFLEQFANPIPFESVKTSLAIIGVSESEEVRISNNSADSFLSFVPEVIAKPVDLGDVEFYGLIEIFFEEKVIKKSHSSLNG